MESPFLNNRYKIIRSLGSGGFGDTFLAEDTQMPSGRYCVIKELKSVTLNPQVAQMVQERFQREATILEVLGEGNPQIPSLYAYFCEDGYFYLVQEWIQGQTLTQKVEADGVMHEGTVREILIGLLNVLDYVHRQRIVHRDIKPDNIILGHRDGKPVLIDFGAVKESMGTILDSQGSPASSIVIGTPGFMPSEQAVGRPVYASDLYSLGLTAIYLLTAKMPQALDSDPQTGEILWHKDAQRVSPLLASILDKAIHPHSRERFTSAREMLRALDPAMSEQVAVPAPCSALATVAVTHAIPRNQQQSPPQILHRLNKTDYLRSIVIGSMIIGIFGSLGGFLANRREPALITQSPIPALTEVPQRPQDLPNPTATPTSSQSTSKPIVTSAPLSTNLATATPSKQTPGTLAAPSLPIEQTSVPTSTAITSPNDPAKKAIVSKPVASPVAASYHRAAPDQFIRDYYAAINNRQYQQTWLMLSAQFKNEVPSLNSYQDWWNSIERVEVIQTDTHTQKANTAEIAARLRYFKKNGEVVDSNDLFQLVVEGNNWVINKHSY
jgi:serine/threonine protein kinase, bacterial